MKKGYKIRIVLTEDLGKYLEEMSEKMGVKSPALARSILIDRIVSLREKMVRSGIIPKQKRETPEERENRLFEEKVQKFINDSYHEVVDIEGVPTAVWYYESNGERLIGKKFSVQSIRDSIKNKTI